MAGSLTQRANILAWTDLHIYLSVCGIHWLKISRTGALHPYEQRMATPSNKPAKTLSSRLSSMKVLGHCRWNSKSRH